MSGQERDLEERKREAACLQVVDTAMAVPVEERGAVRHASKPPSVGWRGGGEATQLPHS